ATVNPELVVGGSVGEVADDVVEVPASATVNPELVVGGSVGEVADDVVEVPASRKAASPVADLLLVLQWMEKQGVKMSISQEIPDHLSCFEIRNRGTEKVHIIKIRPTLSKEEAIFSAR
ncbi:hypothetical protein PENTCL1PPCAC_15288, partial [Pristionchus entomophagus]